MKIAVDAMGGDFAPANILEGAALALSKLDWLDELVLVGHQEKIAFYMDKLELSWHPKVRKVHAASVVEMRDPSTAVLRGKRDSSMTVCAKLLRDREVDAIVSAGHTGAAVASSTVLARTLPGIDRPAIATIMPNMQGRFVLIDAGANTDCKPFNLAQFAIMGECYYRLVFGVENARVGLLSVGGEDIKGNEVTKETFKLLSGMPLNFIGNVEGNTIFEGAADVVVCDGFIGNVLLKSCEGLARTVMYWLKDAFTKDPIRKTGAMLAKNAFRDLKEIGDADSCGGAPLLGINGVCIIGHGSSSPKAVYNAIRVAGESVKYRMNDMIVKRIAECGINLEKKNLAEG
ncbi:MAG: phosphate acyltransferase PlsX [Victivallales bacterium]|nr:phosphate acyltransferase PlsX [Victivallales bacterium]